MLSMRIALGSAAFAAIVASATAVRADNAATGVWIDHTGRGAVEITECNGKLCGHVVWVKDAANNDGCGLQIIGNVKSVGTNKWDNGWIYDPDRDTKYDVALATIGTDKLKVTGYAGTKWLSETYTWKRAPADLQKCGTSAAAAPATGDSAKSEPPKADVAKPAPEALKPADPVKPDDKADAAKPADPKAAETKPAETKPAEPKADSAKSEPAPDATKSDTAKTDEAKPGDTKTDEAKKDTAKKDEATEEEDTADKASKEDAGKIVSRIIESLDEGEEGDGPKKKGNCKFNVPYADITISVPCDK